MNSKQRLQAILNRESADRVPVDLWYTGEVAQALAEHTGISDELEMYRKYGIDKILWINAPYTGELPKPQSPNEIVTHWGVRMKPVQSGLAEYHEFIENPLADMEEIEELDEYPWWPDPEKFDYEAVDAMMKRAGDEFATLGPWVSFFEIYCGLRGLENALCDLLAEPEFVQHALDRIEQIQTAMMKKILDRHADQLDMIFISDDMGTQNGLMISLDNWKEFLGPRMKRWCDMIHSYGVKVFFHTDGAVRPLIPLLIEAGIDVLNPIQHVCPGMDMKELKAEFGEKIIFHGAVDNQSVLPFGSAEDVRKETQNCLESFAPDGQGFICCSCHNMQAGIPVENVLTLVETAHQYKF